MQKVRFEVDPYNRLVLNKSGKKSDLTRFRKVLDGQFKIDEDSNISYHVKSPLSESENIPNQIRLRGEWSLTDDHCLRLTLDKQSRQTFGDEITLQGMILDVKENSLLFAMTTTTKENTRSTYVLNLEGAWKADEHNKLTFHVRKEGGIYDILTFNGSWEINKNNEIIYQYEKSKLIKKKGEVHTLIFRGRWDINKRMRISYLLSGSTDSTFDFSASLGIFNEGFIKYEIGIGLTGRPSPVRRTVTLSGRWNLKKDVGLVFEIEYGNGRTDAIIFGADAKLTDRDTVSFKLKNDIENKDIGITLELSRKILEGDGETFLRVLMSSGESAIYAGAAWRW